ncbi:MAG TPA: helix-turn-helix transcriptional regulator [Opitutus sp.]|nr:helix-turn-helix transcriptional regulator [Opitutus sp.]
MTSETELERRVARLPQPPHPLLGRRPGALDLPDNIVCFQRRSASELNRPRRGRALHHRCVLMIALRTAATVCVDDRVLRLHAGEALLVLPFQFHHYLDPERDSLLWLFVTFDLADASQLEPLRFKPFVFDSSLRALAGELVVAYEEEGRESDLPALLLAVLLARLRRLGRSSRRVRLAAESPRIVTEVNQLAQRAGGRPSVQEISRRLGISPSHLRARFRASCGVSIGRHLRRLRLEKACGLLRLTGNRVTEIAEQCGFNSIYHFSRAFRTAYGMAPLAYRKGDGRAGAAGRARRR